MGLLSLFGVNSSSQESIFKLTDFKKVDINTMSSDDLLKLNNTLNEFEVQFLDGELLINKALRGRNTSELVIDEGVLKGYDKGEWGGQLSFLPKSSDDLQEIKSGNIVDIFKMGDDIYFVEGLAHLHINEGALFKLDVGTDSITYEKIVDFDDAPEAITVFEDSILIAAHNSFYIVKEGKCELIFANTFWRNLYPNSIAYIDEQNVYIGMRGGIAKLNLIDENLIFYRYK